MLMDRLLGVVSILIVGAVDIFASTGDLRSARHHDLAPRRRSVVDGGCLDRLQERAATMAQTRDPHAEAIRKIGAELARRRAYASTIETGERSAGSIVCGLRIVDPVPRTRSDGRRWRCISLI